jgi:hypothetical protein
MVHKSAKSEVGRGNLLRGSFRIGALAAIGLGLMAVGCGGEPMDEDEDTGTVELATDPEGHNGTPKVSLTGRYLKRARTDAAGITGPGETRPSRLCGPAVYGNYCEISGPWDVWQNTQYPDERGKLLEAMVYCAMPANFYAYVPGTGGGDFEGKFGLVPGWKTNRLSVAEQEILSGCVLARINAHLVPNSDVPIAIVGPADPATPDNAAFKYMEGIFYGNLFLPSPTMIACGGIKESGTNLVLGRHARVCTEQATEPCGIDVMGACNGPNYVLGSSGYCTQWEGTGDGVYCKRARDDGSYVYNYPTTVYLKEVSIPLPGSVSHCGIGGTQSCPIEF